MLYFLSILVLFVCASCVDGHKIVVESGSKLISVDDKGLPISQMQALKADSEYGIVSGDYEISRHRLKKGQTAAQILQAGGRSSSDVYKLEQLAKDVFPLHEMQAGNLCVSYSKTDSVGRKRLEYLVYERDPLRYVVYDISDDEMSVKEASKPVTIKRRSCNAVIENSLWAEIMKQDMPYALASEMETIYQWSVDFFSIQKGDSFSVIFEELFVNDSLSVGLGRVIGAKFTQGNQSYYAIPFTQDEKTEYWDEEGGSLRKQLLKAPLKYSRISSKFSNSRLHPVLKVYRPHHGVDYAAPSGTPVYAVADGQISYRGYDRASGNMIKIKHANSIQTAYLHLSRFAKGISRGKRVNQGDLIGYVGSTGYSTGPHLDYRIWVSGKPVNPLTVAQNPVKPIKDENRALFDAVCKRVKAEIDGEEFFDYEAQLSKFSYSSNFEKFLLPKTSTLKDETSYLEVFATPLISSNKLNKGDKDV